MAEKIINVDNSEQLSELFGRMDDNIQRIAKEYNVNIVLRDGGVKCSALFDCFDLLRCF